MARRRSKRFEITIASDTGRAVVTPVPTSRIKMMASVLGITLALAPAPWAFKTYDSPRADNGTKAVGTRERVELLPGTAQSTRDGEPRPAATTDGQALSIDLGQIQAGSSTSFTDLFRIRNAGTAPQLVYVEPTGISAAAMHASISGDRAPGVFWIEAGETRHVDLGLAADLVAVPGDFDGDIALRAASGLVRREVPTRWTVTGPAEDTVLATLLAAAGVTNPGSGGFGKLGDPAAGIEKPDFEVGGVWDGAIFASSVEVSWRPLGPLAQAKATIDGRRIGRTATVDSEGDHVLKMEALIMGSVRFEREVRFRIDRTAPGVWLVTSPVTFGDPARFSVRTEDASPVAGVEVLLLRRTEKQPQSSPSPTSAPTPAPSPSPSPGPSPTPTPTPSPTPSPTPTATPDPGSSANGTKAQEPGPIRAHATYDEEREAWVVDVELERGTYDVWAEAVDLVGNRTVTSTQRVEVLRALVPDLQ